MMVNNTSKCGQVLSLFTRFASREYFTRTQLSLGVKSMIALLSLTLAGCSSKLDPDREYVDYYYSGRPAQPPSGVLRYCWEEPIVDYESQGPGVREEGRWYYPSAVVVRQVRAGRWRPCEVRPDESKGETSNER
jgi:hypothetical protein